MQIQTTIDDQLYQQAATLTGTGKSVIVAHTEAQNTVRTRRLAAQTPRPQLFNRHATPPKTNRF